MPLHIRRPGHVALASGAAGLGILCLICGGFVAQWQPVPSWLPWKHALAYGGGVVLFVGGVGVLMPRFAARSALALTGFGVIWIVAAAQKLLPNLTSIGHWLGVAEAMAATLGCFALAASVVAGGAPLRLAFIGRRGSMRIVEVLFGASCVVFGLAHFAYADFTAAMIPQWLPARTALAYATGACHIAAGLALMTTLFARIAATLEAIMLGAFVLLVHVPSLATSPTWASSRQIQWTELFLALLIAGSAGVVASSIRRASSACDR